MRILILFAHPAVQKSRINRRLREALRDLPGVTHHDLYQHYPEYDIDVAAEQRLLAGHDVIAFQHPLFWYSVPALLKEWLDLVLEHGWAYGSRGYALQGKLCLNLVSCGGGQAAYSEEGFNRMGVRRLLAPIENTARLCRMRYLAPFVIHGTHSIPDSELEEHCRDLRRILEDLQHDRLDLEAAGAGELLNGCPSRDARVTR